MVNLYRDLMLLRDAALQAVDPAQAVREHLRVSAHRLWVGETAWDLTELRQVRVIAAGKAAVPMAEAAHACLGTVLTAGIVVTKTGHAAGCALPETFQVYEAEHPTPGPQGLRAAGEVLRLLEHLSEDDLVLVLLSGGASALLPAPVADISLSDLQAVTTLLLRSGAPIEALNTVRKHLSRLAGGQLARLAAPAAVTALVLSDVVGDPLDVIASGPTTPDSSTYADAWQVLEQLDLLSRIPEPVREHLAAGVSGMVNETPKPGDPCFTRVSNRIIGSNRVAALATAQTAQQLGYRVLLLSTFVEGESREVARVAAAMMRSVRINGDPVASPACLLWGGETTVTVRGNGTGGRNQELALAAAMALDGLPDVALLALATDGTDGPTDAAGAVVDGATASHARALGIDLHAALLNNDAYAALAALGALLHTGPTGTNVNDLLLMLIA
ncbi:MAG: glycerate kinase [Anaerolineae bacterium]|jgi:hydroxypyruvate reductase|nr:glycerate kinase [Anaerolineae bacterium]